MSGGSRLRGPIGVERGARARGPCKKKVTGRQEQEWRTGSLRRTDTLAVEAGENWQWSAGAVPTSSIEEKGSWAERFELPAGARACMLGGPPLPLVGPIACRAARGAGPAPTLRGVCEKKKNRNLGAASATAARGVIREALATSNRPPGGQRRRQSCLAVGPFSMGLVCVVYLENSLLI